LITIDEADISHIREIKQVLSEVWQDTYRSVLGADTIDKVTSHWHSPDVLQHEIESDSIYMGIASSSMQVVGMITAHEKNKILHVSRLYVLPAFQRLGIGTQLLNAGYSVFSKAKRVRLEVEEKNPIGVSFYSKRGFDEVDRVTSDIFGVSLRSIIMEREIQPSTA